MCVCVCSRAYTRVHECTHAHVVTSALGQTGTGCGRFDSARANRGPGGTRTCCRNPQTQLNRRWGQRKEGGGKKKGGDGIFFCECDLPNTGTTLRQRAVRLHGAKRQRLGVMACRVACCVVVRYCYLRRQPVAGRSLFYRTPIIKRVPYVDSINPVFPLPPPLPSRRERDKLRSLFLSPSPLFSSSIPALKCYDS